MGPSNELLYMQRGSKERQRDCRIKMKRAASDDGDGGAKKAPRMSPGPSRQSPSYSIESDPSEDPTEGSYDTDPSEDPATIPPELLTPRAEVPAEGGYDTDPSEDPSGDSYDTDPSEDPSMTPPESPIPGAEDPVEDGYDTDISEDQAMTPPELLTSAEEDSYEADLSEPSSGTTEEEIFRYAPIVTARVNPDSPATSESAMDFSRSWPESPVRRELSDSPYSLGSDAGYSGGRLDEGQTDEDDDGHTSYGSSSGQTRN
ncbi:uncharacterized protein LOC132044369 [Lycium ferocissimum]|uniref:uncharacterized protein LOC132044369 n=1 Tax=Lycium ferocissimum TaxID=112874 RepID=UPI0028154926|nr:uncharacterized protein LOC132044369 [Lycium ferocissimum]